MPGTRSTTRSRTRPRTAQPSRFTVTITGTDDGSVITRNGHRRRQRRQHRRCAGDGHAARLPSRMSTMTTARPLMMWGRRSVTTVMGQFHPDRRHLDVHAGSDGRPGPGCRRHRQRHDHVHGNGRLDPADHGDDHRHGRCVGDHRYGDRGRQRRQYRRCAGHGHRLDRHQRCRR